MQLQVAVLIRMLLQLLLLRMLLLQLLLLLLQLLLLLLLEVTQGTTTLLTRRTEGCPTKCRLLLLLLLLLRVVVHVVYPRMALLLLLLLDHLQLTSQRLKLSKQLIELILSCHACWLVVCRHGHTGGVTPRRNRSRINEPYITWRTRLLRLLLWRRIIDRSSWERTGNPCSSAISWKLTWNTCISNITER